MIAATGAKNGRGCPMTLVAIRYATAAASPAWTTERQATRTRCRRARTDTRPRSAASSRYGWARSGIRRRSGTDRSCQLLRRAGAPAVADEHEAEHRLVQRLTAALEALA